LTDATGEAGAGLQRIDIQMWRKGNRLVQEYV